MGEILAMQDDNGIQLHPTDWDFRFPYIIYGSKA